MIKSHENRKWAHTHTHTENSDLGDKIEEEEERLRELKTGVCGAELCLDS